MSPQSCSLCSLPPCPPHTHIPPPPHNPTRAHPCIHTSTFRGSHVLQRWGRSEQRGCHLPEQEEEEEEGSGMKAGGGGSGPPERPVLLEQSHSLLRSHPFEVIATWSAVSSPHYCANCWECKSGAPGVSD